LGKEQTFVANPQLSAGTLKHANSFILFDFDAVPFFHLFGMGYGLFALVNESASK